MRPPANEALFGMGQTERFPEWNSDGSAPCLSDFPDRETLLGCSRRLAIRRLYDLVGKLRETDFTFPPQIADQFS